MAARVAEIVALLALLGLVGGTLAALRVGADTIADEVFWWSTLVYVAGLVVLVRTRSRRLRRAGAVGAFVGGPAFAAGWLGFIMGYDPEEVWLAGGITGAAGLAAAVAAAVVVFPVRWVAAGATLFVLGLLLLVVWIGFFLAPVGLLVFCAGLTSVGGRARAAALLLLGSVAAYGGGAGILEALGEDGAYAVFAFAPLHGAGWVALGAALGRR